MDTSMSSEGAGRCYCWPIIFEMSWITGELPEDWKKAHVMPVFNKGKKEVPGNYRPVSLTSVPGKAMEQLILEVISSLWKRRR